MANLGKQPARRYPKSGDPVARTAIEFFAGIGLMRMGLEKAGWGVVYANDIDPLKLEMYREQFGEESGHFVLGDIHKLNAQKIPSATLATASFPCTDLSLAGARQGLAGAQSSAFWGFIDAIRGMGARKPPLLLVENVTGFLTSHQGRDFQEALLALNQLGYSVDPLIIDASRFVPQSRQRLFIVGVLNEARSVESRGSLAFYESEARPKALADFIFNHPEIDWALRDLPHLPERDSALDDILESIPPESEIWWNEERVTYLLDQMSVKHRTTADEMMRARRWSTGTVFRRVRNGKSMAELRTDGIAGCLRTPKGGSGRQILLRAGYGKVMVRLLTARECARLMGADDFKIVAPLNQALFGFGDAVCVSVVEWLAINYLEPVSRQFALSIARRESDSLVAA